MTPAGRSPHALCRRRATTSRARWWPVPRLPSATGSTPPSTGSNHMSLALRLLQVRRQGIFDGINAVLQAPQPLLFAGILAVIAFWLRGLSAGLSSPSSDSRSSTPSSCGTTRWSTLSLVLVATAHHARRSPCPLGIWAARSDRVSSVVRPVLDFMQTHARHGLPDPGDPLLRRRRRPAGIVATIIFALPPGVRMTELGIRQVDGELVEAADAFGTTPRNTLLRVQLPLALPTIMAGVNQVIMLGLSMVVIAGMVGAGGLGGDVYQAIGHLDVGLGFEAGVAIVILAMYLDRMTSALGTPGLPARPPRRRQGCRRRRGPEDLVLPPPARRRRRRRRRPRARRGRHGHLRRLDADDHRVRRRERRPGQEGHHRLHPVGRGHRLHLPLEGDAGAARLRGRRQAVRRRPALHRLAHGQTSTSRPTPGCPTTHAQYWKKYGQAWTTWAPGTARPRWSWPSPRT